MKIIVSNLDLEIKKTPLDAYSTTVWMWELKKRDIRTQNIKSVSIAVLLVYDCGNCWELTDKVRNEENLKSLRENASI